jgi:polyphenol oxidase
VYYSFEKKIAGKIFCNNNGALHLDLWKANQSQLIKEGVIDKNIEISGLCTKCNSHQLFSSRMGSGKTGRFVAGIMLQ